MIETGNTVVANSGVKTITLASPFTSTPVVYVTAGPGAVSPPASDPGAANIPSYNVNLCVTGIAQSSGAWTFTVNTEGLDEAIDPEKVDFTNVQLVWRAVGPVSAT